MAPQNRDTGMYGISDGGTRDLLRSVSTKTGVKWLETPIISLLYFTICLKFRDGSVSHQQIEAYLQMVETILTVIIVIILFLLFAPYICKCIMNFVSKQLEAFKLQMIVHAPAVSTASGPLDQRPSI